MRKHSVHLHTRFLHLFHSVVCHLPCLFSEDTRTLECGTEHSYMTTQSGLRTLGRPMEEREVIGVQHKIKKWGKIHFMHNPISIRPAPPPLVNRPDRTRSAHLGPLGKRGDRTGPTYPTHAMRRPCPACGTGIGAAATGSLGAAGGGGGGGPPRTFLGEPPGPFFGGGRPAGKLLSKVTRLRSFASCGGKKVEPPPRWGRDLPSSLMGAETYKPKFYPRLTFQICQHKIRVDIFASNFFARRIAPTTKKLCICSLTVRKGQ